MDERITIHIKLSQKTIFLYMSLRAAPQTRNGTARFIHKIQADYI